MFCKILQRIRKHNLSTSNVQTELNKSYFDGVGEQIDSLYICSKIIEELNKSNRNNNPLTTRRLRNLILLIEVGYMQNFNKALIKQDYEYYAEINGLMISKTWHYLVLEAKEGVIENIPFNKEQYEANFSLELTENINQIIKEIVEITEYIDTVDLASLVWCSVPTKWHAPQNREPFCSGKYPIPKSIIYEIYRDFDFNKLKEKNEQERVNFNI